MEPVTLLPFRPDGWTIEDLDDLPDDDLAGEVDRETGRFTDQVVIDNPGVLRFRLDALFA
jgi:hypothetical protein